MKEERMSKISFDDHLGCFGDFNIKDLICKKYCALSLRCAIEQDQNARLEVLEELVSPESTFFKIQ